jgi:putative zinc finger protein/sigma-70-like protein
VSDPEAVRHLASHVPAADERDRLALALVALAGHGRAEVARRLGIDEEEVSAALARARKELRRTVLPLPGSGWCERAERLISDRLDDALPEREERRLSPHLRNCPRCVEHERRLVQATDALIARLPTAPASPYLAPVPEAAPVELEPVAAEPEPDSVAGWYALIVVSLLLAIAAITLVVAGAFA